MKKAIYDSNFELIRFWEEFKQYKDQTQANANNFPQGVVTCIIYDDVTKQERSRVNNNTVDHVISSFFNTQGIKFNPPGQDTNGPFYDFQAW